MGPWRKKIHRLTFSLPTPLLIRLKLHPKPHSSSQLYQKILQTFFLTCLYFWKSPQGHCHPKIIIKALQEQVKKLSLGSRAFYNDQFPIFAERLTNMLGYEMVLPMNTGAEGVETALKIARKWSWKEKHPQRWGIHFFFCFICFTCTKECHFECYTK